VAERHSVPDSPDSDSTDSAHLLWYTSPAERWFEALPVGNGRSGGMVYSGHQVERVQLAETTAWSGAPSATDVAPSARTMIPRIRELLFAGRNGEAQELVNEHLLGRPTSFGTNLPLPELIIRSPGPGPVTGFRRGLDLRDAIVRTSYEAGRVAWSREVFASHPDRVVAVRIEAGDRGACQLTAQFDDCVFPVRAAASGHVLVLDGRATETRHSDGRTGVDIQVRVRLLLDGGTATAADGRIEVTGADAVTFLIGIGTSWAGADPEAEARAVTDRAAALAYPELRARHVADYRELFERVTLDLGPASPDRRALPTDDRRLAYAEGGQDPELESLFFQYGRYLTIAGSRADSPLPLALQGLWNDGRASSASWTDDFHLDINTQQNYWAAEVTNLPESHEPLIALVGRLSAAGRDTAAQMYGLPGWVAHTVTNAWGYSAPGSGAGWGLHVTAGVWIALHLWDHYEFSQDTCYLRERAYPVLRGAAEFFLAYLCPHPERGWLVTGPSDSPENWYRSPAGDTCAASMGNTCDRVFVDELFSACIRAAAVLGVDASMSERLVRARALLPPFQIGKHGQLQEWLEDWDEAEPNHRHTSHLCALYPARQITPRATPGLARAAEITIDRRTAAAGWEQTEWVEANFAGFYARLGQGDQARSHVRALLGAAAEANLLTYSAGGVAGAAQNIYSFDGNAGGTAGIAEMLLQSDGEELELLPALPTAWPAGTVTGLRARGGLSVDIHWRDGRLLRARITASSSRRMRVRYGQTVADESFTAGEARWINELKP
jgi:alpha-L-fucosidase 2